MKRLSLSVTMCPILQPNILCRLGERSATKSLAGGENNFTISNRIYRSLSKWSIMNALGLTRLIRAIHRGAGWELLDALLSQDVNEHILFDVNENGHYMFQT